MTASITRWVLAHRRLVLCFWLLLAVVGVASVGSATKRLSDQFSVPGREGYETNSAITRAFGNGGDSAPLVAVVTLPSGTSVDSPGVTKAISRISSRLQTAIPHARVASYASTGDRVFVSADGRTTFVLAYPPPKAGSFGQNPQAVTAAGAALRGIKVAGSPVKVGTDVRVGGIVAQNSDFINAVYGSFPVMIAVIALLTFVLLARAFRSLLLPAKAVILNVLSVAAAWGVITLVWQHGYGSETIWGIPAAGSIPSWLPLMVFAFLFGLSMDYEVFILARMREEYDRTGSTSTAVVHGIGRTGRLVTSAALIMFLGFIAMASAPSTQVKMIATGLGAGIILDATIVRALLVPAMVSLFGRFNWWLPQPVARILRVAPQPMPATEPSGA